MIKKNKKFAGFSFVELMISIFILSLIMLASVAVFSSIVKARKDALKVSTDIETGREAIEIMAKNIRMSSHLGGSSSTIYFYSELVTQCISYQFNGTMLRSAYRNPLSGGDEDCSPGHLGSNYSYTPITSADMSAVGFFNITQTSTTDPKKVGRATIVMQVDGGTYSLQTTIAFRNYEGVI